MELLRTDPIRNSLIVVAKGRGTSVPAPKEIAGYHTECVGCAPRGRQHSFLLH
jgi:hypothetical protein